LGVLKTYLAENQTLINEALLRFVGKAPRGNEKIYETVLYSIEAGGKRVRPILTLATADALGTKPRQAFLPLACAFEMIHTYSLIHDDLPAMDDDDLRRGKPTNHKVFGDASAILAGDALLTKAFEVLTLSNDMNLDVIREVAQASGIDGMVGGQLMDLEAEGKNSTLEQLERIHRCKTGALLRASVVAAAKYAGATANQIENLDRYGKAIGLAFQIADDVLDVVGGAEIGKDIGSDLEKDKTTFPKLMGIEASQKKAKECVDEALKALEIFDDRAWALRDIAQYIISRNH